MPPAGQPRLDRLRRLRRATQVGFFVLFLLAPALNLLRFDLNETQLWVLGMRWNLGIDAFVRGETTATQAALAIMLRGMLPALLLVAAFLAVAWRWGRLYCGWLCPHFSLVEVLNDLLHRACGKLSFWDAQPTPRGTRQPQKRWWPLFALACLMCGFTWAITLLTYLLPPAEVWGNLVVAFDRERARDCRSCSTPQSPAGAACDQVCPMRLKPRNIKRLMFSCVQCGQCLTACDASHTARDQAPSLEWHIGLDAVRETLKQRRQEH